MSDRKFQRKFTVSSVNKGLGKMGEVIDNHAHVLKDVIPNKISVIANQIGGIYTFLGDLETRIETLKTLAIRKDFFREEDYNAVWDEIKGLRLRAVGEKIENDDFVRVTFKIFDAEEKAIGEEKNIPILIGSKRSILEEDLVGKSLDNLPLDFDIVKEFPQDYALHPKLAGKKINIKGKVLSVKERLKKELKD